MISILKHKRRTRRRTTVLSAVALVALISYLSLVISVQSLPEGFVSEIVNPRTKAVTGVVAPNLRRTDHRPMMMVASKEGRVRVLENPETLNDGDSYTNKEDDVYDRDSNVILDLFGEGSICDNGQRGLKSIAIHPDFLETRWVYLYYTRWREGCMEDYSLGPQNILVRYTMNAQTLILENEELLLECGILAERIRNGGAMMFGTDGYLYLATGDGGVRTSAQNRRNLQGSMLRLNDDGSVPEDNPYAGVGVPCGKSNGIVPDTISDGEDVYCSEIYSWGFRNPVRMALNHEKSDENTVLFSISDVGAQRFEELSWAGTNFKEKNYGWPELEGPCAFKAVDDCPLPSPDSNLVDPFHYYVHTSLENGGSVAGSTFVPDGIWPKEYKYLFIDFILLKIYNLIEDPGAECRESCSPPTSRFINTTFYESTKEESENVNEARMVDMFFGPYKDTQALYVIKYGNNNSILRIRYIGSPPVAVIEVRNKEQEEKEYTASSFPILSNVHHIAPDPSSQILFLVGDAVRFDGSRSFDPDGNELTFQWDFGDGNDSTTNTTKPSHAYDKPGEYTVILVVTNSKKQAHLASTTVVIENFPTAVILSPMEGDLFALEEILHLNGEAYDYQGSRIPDDQMSWEVRQFHSDGFDFFLEETSGNDFDLNPVAVSGDFSSADIIFLRVILFATDDNGLITKVVTDLYPNIVTVELVTEPEGLKINIDDNELVTPMRIQSWMNFDLPVQIIPDQPPYKFQRWSDGNTNTSRAILLPPQEASTARMTRANITIVTMEAIFCLVDNASCSNATTSYCCGYCDKRGFCAKVTQESTIIDFISTTENPVVADPISISTPKETNVISRPIFTEEGIEPARKPVIPNVTNLIEDETKMILASGNTVLEEGQKEEENNYTYGLRPLGKWLIGISIIFLLIALLFFAWKYFQLKRKLETKSNDSSSSEFKDKSVPPKSIETTSGEKENASSGVVNSDETNASLSTSNISSTSNASFSSTSTSFNKTAAIWDKIAEETERRAKLRAKYSSGAAASTTTPGTPETITTRESPSNLDSESSPSGALTTNIDETLVRLDDLLAKCFTRKLTRSCRKEEQTIVSLEEGTCKTNNAEGDLSDANIIETTENNDLAPIWISSQHESATVSPLKEKSDDSYEEQKIVSLEEGTCETNNTEDDLSNANIIETTENNDLAPICLSSKHESTTVSPLKEKNDDSYVEATFSMTSLYSAGSLQDVSNESLALNLPEVSTNSLHSLLIFQDNDLSISNKGSSVNEIDVHDSLMESGIAGDGDMNTRSGSSSFNEFHLDNLAEDGDRIIKSDFTSFDKCHLLIGDVDDLAGDGHMTKKSDLTSIYEHHLLVENVDDIAGNGDRTKRSDLTSFHEHQLLVGNVDDLAGDGDRTTRSYLTSFDERHLLIEDDLDQYLGGY